MYNLCKWFFCPSGRILLISDKVSNKKKKYTVEKKKMLNYVTLSYQKRHAFLVYFLLEDLENLIIIFQWNNAAGSLASN